MTMTRKTMAAFALAALALGACDSRRGMVVRTYELHRLTLDEAETLITPYVNEGGYISGKNRLMTVRERPERLDSIAAILRRYDGAPVQLTLRFQVIEAGDFAGGDSSIARVEAPLREMFRYRGYRLIHDLRLHTMEGAGFSQEEAQLRVQGTVREARLTGPDPHVTLEVSVGTERGNISTGVSGAPGKTMVIGTQQQSGGAR
jgi:hypothetical protein